MVKKRRFLAWFITVFAFILVGTGSWAFYNFLNTGIEDMLLNFGISNPYLQSGIIISIVFIGLVIFGSGVFKAIDRIIGK